MQQETQSPISLLPLELLAAIFDQLISHVADEIELPLPETSGSGDGSAGPEDEDERAEERGDKGSNLKKSATSGYSSAQDAAMDSVRGVLTAATVCSGWHEIIIKENALWKRLTLARWQVWEDTTWRTRRKVDWRGVHFERVRRDKEVLSLLAPLARTDAHSAAIQRLHELGMDVWEKLMSLAARWRRHPLQHLGRLHTTAICVQALTEQRIKKGWNRILPSIALPERDDDLSSGSDSDADQREDMDSATSCSGTSSGTTSSSSGGGGSSPEGEREYKRRSLNVEDEDEATDEVHDDGEEDDGRKRSHRVDIEEGAILIASWEHAKDLNVRRKVYGELDEIARTVRRRLARNVGGGEAEEGCETDGLDEETILKEVNATLYDHLGFSGNATDYMDPNNSFIDRVLENKTGIPITLAIVYAAVCRRLHIRIDMIGMPGHFMVKYTTPAGQEVFIDAFSEGRCLTAADCRGMLEAMGMTLFSPELLRPVGHLAVYERMLANLLGVYQRLRQTDKLLGVAKQLLILRGENSAEDLLTCCRLHMLLDQFAEARPLVRRVLDTCTNPEYLEQARTIMVALESQMTAQEAAPPKRRPADPNQLRFRVGQVIHHVRHSYRGVIFGWDTVCSATPAWIREMRVDELPLGRNQPFYSVLVDVRDKPGHWTTYVAQENIEVLEEGHPVEHAQVGAFFSRFDEQAHHFVPNPELCSRYPDDYHYNGSSRAVGEEEEDCVPPPTAEQGEDAAMMLDE